MNYKNKLRITKLLAVIVAICSVFSTLSCSGLMSEIPDVPNSISEINNNSVLQAKEYRFINKIYKIYEGTSIWKAQLDKIIENNSLIKQSELELVSYQYVGKIHNQNELEKIKSEMIDNNTFFPVYEDNSRKFVIVEQGMSKNNYDLLLDMLIPDSEYTKALVPVKSDKSPLSEAVYFFEKNDLSMVNLEWKYKGKILNTRCLVSEKKGIVFDNFLYFIYFVSF